MESLAMSRIRTIIHPTDFSENARHAFEAACALARENQAILFVLHVMMPSVVPTAHGPPDPLRSVESQKLLPQLPWPEPADPQLRVERRLAEGNPAEEILRLAGALRCDVIVMGTHGRTGLGRLLTGSVAEAVLRKADCPVMVVKMPLPPAPLAEAETTAGPGEPIDIRPLGTALASARTRTLLRVGALQLVRLVVRAGQEIPPHKTKGETIVHCLEGKVEFTALGRTSALEAGDLLYLPPDESHALKGVEDASVLLTIISPGD
jgi:nucleotide-binding universal stress UspA family protein/quercetin dioxygenase-like cupin family protein